MQEPSVLDFVKSIFKDWKSFSNFIGSFRSEAVREEINRALAEEIHEHQPEVQVEIQPEPEIVAAPAARVGVLPWRSFLALILALIGQFMFEPPTPKDGLGVGFYVLALAMLIWSILESEWNLAAPRPDSSNGDPQSVRVLGMISTIILSIAAFLSLGGNLFTPFNFTLWILAIGCVVLTFWVSRPRRKKISAPINWGWVALIVALSALVIFFRVYHVQQTPSEPFSDHAEKILDVYDVSRGQTHIFFPRNTGREAIQMYWTVFIAWVFQTGLSFLSLKIGTVIFGLMTLPYVYLLGKEIANERVGLLAFAFTGVAYWPNVIARIGLRFPLTPLFVAPTLLYLIRGLRTRNRNDFILSGLFLGLSLHGYSPSRIVPFLIAAAVLLYIIHAQSKGVRRDAVAWFTLLGFVSLIVFIPLLRYSIEYPDQFSYRALSRLGSIETPLPGVWYQIFISNIWSALKMFNVDNGNIWVNSIPNRPALDVISGALFLIGIILLAVRYFQKRHWLDLFLLISIPMLQLPSTLSLAYPAENPAMNRAGGALIPVFIVVALALDGLMSAFGSEKKRMFFAWALTGILFFVSAAQNYDLVFNQFDSQYRETAWNSSEMGAVIQQFDKTYGETDTVWIVPFPYWVDTRLPGVWAGIPNRDFAIFPDHLTDTLQITAPKLFLLKANVNEPETNDQADVDMLKQLYPNGQLSLHQSAVAGHDFWVFFVPVQ